MERVAFLVEGTGERVDCLLNPETVEVCRLAGIRHRGTGDGQLVGVGQRDDPLQFTGGGRTELRLDLMVDLDLVAGVTPTLDVRTVTGRLWALAENSAPDGARPPRVRLVWGKSWNVPGVVAAIAERFDAFGADGVPRRSWLRLKLVRTAGDEARPPADFTQQLVQTGPAPAERGVSAGGAQPGGPVRLDLLAARTLGSPLEWRQLAEHNGLSDPYDIPPGTTVTAPDPQTRRRTP